ncbi:MAG TPA: hypothetical protein VF323_12705 [Candidatus Limnocylindrales bacterium]
MDHHHDQAAGPRHRHADESVLDIGGDIGALILTTGPEYVDREIEVSPIGDAASRTHTAIHRRVRDGLVAFTGVYPELRAGEYRVWTDDPRLPDRVTIVGGAVAELDWTPEARLADPPA